MVIFNRTPCHHQVVSFDLHCVARALNVVEPAKDSEVRGITIITAGYRGTREHFVLRHFLRF